MIKQKLIEKVVLEFKKKNNSVPVLTFSPGRINLIGEHTDYNNGYVFPAAIDKGIVSAIQKNNNRICTVFAVDKNESFEFSLQNIQPLEKGNWKNYVLGVVSETLKKHKLESNFDIVFAGNIPSGAGLSSSAALENSIIFGLNELFNLKISKEEMIFISQKAEHNFVNVKCGIMDQYASMFGQDNAAILLDCRSLESLVFPIDFKGYEILLINSNVKHSLAESAYNDRRNVCEKIASILNVSSLREVTELQLNEIKNQISEGDFQKALYVIQENNRVLSASKALKENQINQFGQLLFDSHNGLQHQYEVSCKELDYLVEKAKENNGVIGARMMGGGFGGCTINILKKSTIDTFKKEIGFSYNEKFSQQCSFYSVNLSNGVYRVKI
jgi:galactokinase